MFRSMLATSFVSVIFGMMFVMAALFACTDVTAALDGPTNVVYVNVFYHYCGPHFAAGLAWLLALITFFSGLSSNIVSARLLFAMARDGAVPFSNQIMEVHPILQSPIKATFTVFIFITVFQFMSLTIQGDVGVQHLFSMNCICMQISYLIAFMGKVG